MYRHPPPNMRGGRGRGRGRGGRDDGWGRGNFEGTNQYRGGGGGGRGCPPRKTEIKVLANYYKLETVKSMELTQYSVEIKGSSFDKEAKQRVVNTKREPLDLTTSSTMSRRILKKLSDDLMESKRIPVRLISDGGKAAYALEHFLKNANGEVSDSEIFTVSVKKDCEQNDPDANRSRNETFFVELTKAGQVSFVADGRNKGEESRQFLDILLKSALLATGMKVFGRSPRVFYFDTEETKDTWTNRLNDQYRNRNYNLFEPMVGVLNAVKLCSNGNQNDYYIKTSSVIDYAWPPIKIFDPLQKKIGGIRIPKIDSYILDTGLQNEIRKLLTKVKLKAEYFSNAPRRNQTQAENTESRKCIRRNKKLTTDPNYNTDILWISDDANTYGVDYDGKKITIAEYFKIKHGVTIRYPKMPLVCIGKPKPNMHHEWYPLELLSMEFDKIKGANSSEQVRAKLDFYSNNGGYALVQKQKEFLNQAMDLEIERIGNLGLTPDHLLNQYNLRRSSEPVKVTAKILSEPTIHFRNQNAFIKNGSWSVANRGAYNTFETPAKLQSFAYVNFSKDKNNTFLINFFKVASQHGMDVPSDELIAAWKDASDNGPLHRGTGKIVEMVEGAIEKARSIFLHDKTKYFAKRNILPRSRVENPGGFHSDCLVLEILTKEDEVALMLPRHVLFPTHLVTVNGLETAARIMVRVREFTSLVDPFDCYFDRNFMVEREGTRVNATFECYCYELSNGQVVEEKDISEAFYEVVVRTSKVECPSILFAVMDTNEPQNDQYAFIKYLCMYKFGIQSQCIAHSQYESQQRRDQYCSNVAIKVNAKLANSTTNARAWITKDTTLPKNTVPWLEETCTLVMGISKSNQPGSYDSKSIVVASTCLDAYSMRVAHDIRLCSRCSDSIYEDVLVHLTTSILVQYYSVNKVLPKRMLIYREGISEGTFDHVVSQEIDSIRKGYRRFTNEVLGLESHCSCTAGCNLCCPLITFVACMLNTNIKIVPEFPENDGVCRDKYGKGVFNVPSGSCIDDVIVDEPPKNVYGEIHKERMKLNNPNNVTCFSEPGSNGFDFILVAHGSGLGTSKPVHYRVLLNENAVLKAGEKCTPLTREILENLTNLMSYQYSTATKAIRMVPVVYYGSRLAKMTIKYLHYLESQNELDRCEIDMSKLLVSEEKQGDGDSNRSQRRRFGGRRDNQDDGRYIYTRSGTTNDNNIPAYRKSSLLPYFGALAKDGLLIEPFSTHVSA